MLYASSADPSLCSNSDIDCSFSGLKKKKGLIQTCGKSGPVSGGTAETGVKINLCCEVRTVSVLSFTVWGLLMLVRLGPRLPLCLWALLDHTHLTEHTKKMGSHTQCPITLVFLYGSVPNSVCMQTI